ncbi:MAG: glycerophosphodiester phosphodiesterase [Clostridia bacterium]|nr:glycerophosphodiester phosphodiesterase [Clostridia bacterium]
MSYIMITAHSGCEGILPDSLDAVKKGIELKADAVEVDVQLDKNGTLYLSHDEKEDPSKAETLENVFRIIAENNICVNCDLKNPDTLFPLLKLADKYGIPKQKLILSGNIKYAVLESNPDIAKRSRVFQHITNEVFANRNTDASFYESDKAMLMENAKRISNLFKHLGAECINICFDRVDHEIIELYNSFGIKMSLWTVNKPDMQRQFLNENIMNITTLRPSTALQIRNEIK